VWGSNVNGEVGEGTEEGLGFHMKSFLGEMVKGLDEGNDSESHSPLFPACDGVRTVWSRHDRIWSRTNKKQKQFLL